MEENFKPCTVSDIKIFEKCKNVLTQWSNDLPFTPCKDWVKEIVPVSATQYHLYYLSLDTKVSLRTFVLERGGEPLTFPRKIESYDLWEIEPDDLTCNKKVALPETCYSAICDVCSGHGEVTCRICQGSGNVDCQTCFGRGSITKQKKVQCPVCRGTGRVVGKPCDNCKTYDGPRGYVYEDYEVNCTNCHGQGEVRCSMCRGSGRLTCSNCDGFGKISYTYFMCQTIQNLEHGDIWFDKDTPRFSDDFLERNRLPEYVLFEHSVDRKQISPDLLPEFPGCKFIDKVKNVWQDGYNKYSRRTDIAILEQKVQFVKCDAVVKFEYQYKDQKYIAWINLANKKVQEFEDGLIKNFGANFAKIAEKTAWLNPQKAFYNYCKACSIDPQQTNYVKNANIQLNRTAKYFSISALIGFVAMCVFYAFTEHVTNKSILIIPVIIAFILWLLKKLFKKKGCLRIGIAIVLIFIMIGAGQALIEHVTSDNHVIQIYLGLSIVSFVMTLVAFAKDLCQKLCGGIPVTIIVGLLLGGLLGPRDVLRFEPQLAESITWVAGFYTVCLALTILVRWRRRKAIENWQKFALDAGNDSQKLRKFTEKMHPSLLVTFFVCFIIAIFVLNEVLRYVK